MQGDTYPVRFLTFPQVRELVPFTRQHLLKLEKAGKFPRRVQIGENKVAWRADEIARWAAAVSAKRCEK